MKSSEHVIPIPAIEEGTVIDHLPSRETLKVMKLLNPQEFEHPITVALNLDSKKLGKKGVIKVNSRTLTKDEVEKIAILAPQATVSIIKNYKVLQKNRVHVPKSISGIPCSNPNCITNKEPAQTQFELVQESPLRIRCHFCERIMSRKDIAL